VAFFLRLLLPKEGASSMKRCPNCLFDELGDLAPYCIGCGYDFVTTKLPPLKDTKPRCPYPFFGNKRQVATDLWRLFAGCRRYVEPFLGSASMLLARPLQPKVHCVVSDANHYICNFWRAVQQAPEEVAKWCDYPLNETDLHARHLWLEANLPALESLLESDPLAFNAKIAGWWAWGQAGWIGGGWCAGRTTRRKPNPTVQGVNVTHGRAKMKPANIHGIHRPLQRTPEAKSANRVHRRVRPETHNLKGVNTNRLDGLCQWFVNMQECLRDVIVCCQSWERVVTPCVLFQEAHTDNATITAVFLDPPYGKGLGDQCYKRYSDGQLSNRVRAWALNNGHNPRLRIALCEYDGAFEMPADWHVYKWEHGAGMSKGHRNKGRERIWCSPLMPRFHNLAKLRLME
jgi:DNA adenine methylase